MPKKLDRLSFNLGEKNRLELVATQSRNDEELLQKSAWRGKQKQISLLWFQKASDKRDRPPSLLLSLRILGN